MGEISDERLAGFIIAAEQIERHAIADALRELQRRRAEARQEPLPAGTVTEDITQRAVDRFIAEVRNQDDDWTDETDEEQLLVSPSGDYFAPFYPMRATISRSKSPPPSASLWRAAMKLDIGMPPRLHRWSVISTDDYFDLACMPEPNTGCWIWLGTAYATKPGGKERPVLWVNGSRKYAYQYSHERFIGPIPDGMQICHRCNNPLCVNPDHIYAGTSLDNNRDCLNAGTHVSLRWKKEAFQRARRLGKIHKPRIRPAVRKMSYSPPAMLAAAKEGE